MPSAVAVYQTRVAIYRDRVVVCHDSQSWSFISWCM